MTSINRYSALWHYHCFGGRSATAISENPETLMDLHNENIKNPDSCYHNYKENIENITVEPINCFTYNSLTKRITPYNESDVADDSAFYAFNCFDKDYYDEDEREYYETLTGLNQEEAIEYEFDKGEILIYLSKTYHDIWEKQSQLYQDSIRGIPFIPFAEKNSENNSKILLETENRLKNIRDPDLPRFFYTCWPSDLPIIPDFYYEEGIMNA